MIKSTSSRRPALTHLAGLLVLAAIVLLPALGSAAPRTEFAPWAPTGEVVVRFDQDHRPSDERLAELKALPSVIGLRALRGSWPVYALATPPGTNVEALAERIGEAPDIRWATPDLWVDLVPHGAPLNDEYWSQLWHLENRGDMGNATAGWDINAIPAWTLATGLGVKVAVLDGGVDTEHPDLDNGPGLDLVDGDSDPNPGPEQDSPAHGTAVAGLAAALGNNGIGVAGVAWEASIIPVRLLGGPTPMTASYEAFTFSVDQGAAVINNSWGYRVEDCADIPSNSILTDAIDYAEQVGRDGLGTSVTFSMGNMGCHDQEQPQLGHPASIGVGAFSKAGQLHGYSNTGVDTDIVGPSESLRTTDILGSTGMNGLGADYTDHMGGTSGSCPIVSGVIALMYSANPRLTAADVREVLCATADRVNTEEASYDQSGWSELYGCGRVDAGAAVAAVANVAPEAPVFLSPEASEELPVEDLTLRWTVPEDLDGETLRYDLVLRPIELSAGEDDGDDDDSAEEAELPDPLFYEGLTEPQRSPRAADLLPGIWEAQVWAVDRWGRGPASAVLTLTVLPSPEEEDELPEEPTTPDDPDDNGGCSCGTAVGDPAHPVLLLLIALPFLGRRRTSRR